MASSVQILPKSGRPQITIAELEKKLANYKNDIEDYKLLIIGIRGFFPSMGQPGVNDRNIYDDAIILYAPSLNICQSFNGNTDPSRIYEGIGTSEKTKGMAVLKPGVWPVYRFDVHNGSVPHEAICQRVGPLTVIRDGRPPYEDTGNFGINIHRGGFTKTSSLGCQTIPPEQWDDFYSLAKSAALEIWNSAWKKRTMAYVLLEA